MKKLVAAAALTAATIGLAACSSSGAATKDDGGAAPSKHWDTRQAVTEQQVVSALGMTSTDDGISYLYTNPAAGIECTVNVVMRTSETVDVYVSAGDDVAVSRHGHLGLKFGGGPTGDQPELTNQCGQSLQHELGLKFPEE